MSEPRGETEVELLGQRVPYQVVRSEDATEPRIDVDIHEVKVVLPVDSDVSPTTLLEENANWVIKKTRKYEQYREQAPVRRFDEGEQFPFLGHDFAVTIDETPTDRIGTYRIVLPRAEVESKGLKKTLREFYRTEAREVISERVSRYADEIGVEFESVTVRNQRTRWGSCSAKRNLNFNWRLVMAPIEVMDYVVVHELVHLREKNHTNKFWRIVRRFDEQYKQHAKWLEEHSSRLIFDYDDL